MITDRVRLAGAMNRLFWGTLIIALDLNIEMIDILFDPVGAWMVLSACQDVLASLDVRREQRALGLLVPLATAAFVLSIVGVFVPWVDDVLTSTVQLGGAVALARVLAAAFAEHGGWEGVAEKWGRLAVALWVLFWVSLAFQAVGFLVGGARPPQEIGDAGPVAGLFLVVLVALSLVVLVGLLVTLKATEKDLRERAVAPVA